MTVPIRLLLVTPSRLFAEAFGAALGRGGRAELVGTAADPEEALSRLSLVPVGLVLVHPGAGAAAVIRRIKRDWPQLPLVALGMDDRAEQVLDVLEAGAGGYVPAGATLDQALAIIEAAYTGRMVCPPHILAAVCGRLRQLAGAETADTGCEGQRLSPREREVLALIARGLLNKEIARKLGITLCTVKNHVHNLLGKLGVHRRRAAIRYAAATASRPPDRAATEGEPQTQHAGAC